MLFDVVESDALRAGIQMTLTVTIISKFRGHHKSSGRGGPEATLR